MKPSGYSKSMNHVENRALENKCDGTCLEHFGSVEVYEVFENGKSWGRYAYCRTAVKNDTEAGFEVRFVPAQFL